MHMEYLIPLLYLTSRLRTKTFRWVVFAVSDIKCICSTVMLFHDILELSSYCNIYIIYIYVYYVLLV